MTRLNIGAGETFIPGFVNVDIAPWADVSLDLNRDRLPFKDESVDLVFTYHCLEHLDNYLFALGEIHRVLRNQGRLLVGVPYVTLIEYHLVNTYHRQNFNEFSFDFFDPDRLKGSAVEANPVVFKKVFHRFHYRSLWGKTPLRGFFRRHLLNVVRYIDFGLYAIKPPYPHLQPSNEESQALLAEFDQCLRARTPYPGHVLECRTAGVKQDEPTGRQTTKT